MRDQEVELTLPYIGKGFSVLLGGIHDRGSYEGRLEFSVDTDLGKFRGWRDASTHVTFFNIHDGRWNVADNVGRIADPSNKTGFRRRGFSTCGSSRTFFMTGCQFESASSASIITPSQAKQAAG